MSRDGRVHMPGGRYLVIDRFHLPEVLVAAAGQAHEQAELRRLAAHRARYEAQLAHAVNRWCARVHTHCWLPDAALLELQIGWAPLERVMHSLRGSFSREFHRLTGSSERVYTQRYQAWLIEPAHILDLRRFLCQRPVRAGLCRHPGEYAQTSLRCALEGSVPPFLAGSELLAWFERRQSHPREQLVEYFAAAPSAEFTALLDGSPHDRRVIGSAEFLRTVYRAQQRVPSVPLPGPTVEWVTALLKDAARPTQADVSAAPAPDLVQALTAWLVSCAGAGSVSAVARWLAAGSRSGLERMIDQHMRLRPQLFHEVVLRQFVRFLTWQTPRRDAPPAHRRC